MRLRSFLPHVLLTLLLLCGLAACKKKKTDDPAPKPTASYQMNGQPVSCEVRSILSTDSGYDFLEVICVTTPQPAGGPETLHVLFSKESSQPAAEYELINIGLYNSANTVGRAFTPEAGSVTANNDGSFSGTFSGRRRELAGTIYQQDYVVSAGTFKNVKP